ncbi:MAG: hypothetical protein GSR80_000269 [Desulfurococcales archaeon]|nr:hypothetical protein [Desulfurococcales archaeon]
MPRGVVWALLLVAAVAVLPAGLAHYSGEAAPPAVGAWYEPTQIYGLRVLQTNLTGGLTAAALEGEAGVAVIGGNGYAAAVSLNGPRVLWESSVEGVVTRIALDSSGHGSHAAVASDEGEVLVYSSEAGGPLARYYTGQDNAIEGMVLSNTSGGLELAVLTSKGYLRIYRVGQPYWLEIGPQPGEQALKRLGGVKVLEIDGIKLLESWGEWSYTPLLLARYKVLNATLLSRLNVSVYYKQGSSLLPAYTFKYKPISRDRVANATLRLWVLAYPTGILEDLSGTKYPVKANYTALLAGLYPGYYRVAGLYIYRLIDNTTGKVVLTQCYVGESKPVGLGLGDMKSVELVLSASSNCSVGFSGGHLEPYMLINLTGLPGSFSPARLDFRLLPGLKGAAPAATLFYLTGTAPPEGLLRAGARGVAALLYPDKGRIYLVYLDSHLQPVSVNGRYWEDIAVQAPITSEALTPDLSKIFLGTSAGTLYELVWLDSEGKYVAAHSIEATGDEPVSFILPTHSNVVVALSASGLAQAVNETSWRPLWRGAPGYPYLTLPLGGGIVGGAWSGPASPLVVAPFSGSGAPRLLVAEEGLWSTPPLHRVEVNVTVTVRGYNGSLEEYTPGPDSTVEAYREDGTLVASAKLVNGGAALYLPPGTYTMRVNATSWGVVEEKIQVGDYDARITVPLRFRRASLVIYTPPSEPGYALQAGPVAGARVSLEPVGYTGNLSYEPLASSIEAVTGSNGRVEAVLWSGVYYRVTVSKEYYESASYSLPPWGPVNETLPLYPHLYPLRITILDAEASREGVEYSVPANVTIALQGGGEVTLPAPKGVLELGVPMGNYTVAVTAPGYSQYKGQVHVASNTSLEVELEPQYYTVPVSVAVQDNLTNLASGPLAGARVSLSLLDPPLNKTFTGLTGEDGVARLSLRVGLYKLEVSSPITGDYIEYVNITPSLGELRVVLRPLYSHVRIAIYDSELYSAGVMVGNATVTLAYTSTAGGGSLVVEARNGTASLTLPYGLYKIVAEATGYEVYGPDSYAVFTGEYTLKLYMTPVKYPVKLRFVVTDPKWHLAEGPLQGALVTVRILSPALPLKPITGYTDASGSVTLSLRRGVYLVQVEHPYARPEAFEVAVGSPLTLAYTVHPAYTRVNITASDAQTGRPVPGVQLLLEYSGIGPGKKVSLLLPGGTGSFELPAGVYTVAAYEPHYYEATGSFIATPNSSLSEIIKMDPVLVHLRVAVYNQPANATIAIPSRPLANASVTLEPEDPVLKAVEAPAVEASTGPDGSVTLTVRAGVYAYTVSRQGYQEAEGYIDVFKTSQLKVALKPVLYTINVSFRDPGLAPPYDRLANVTIYFESWNGFPLTGRLVLSSGYAIELPAGEYLIRISKMHYVNTTTTLVVAGNESVVFDLQAVNYTVSIALKVVGPAWLKGSASNITIIAAPRHPLETGKLVARTSAKGEAVLRLRYGNYTILAWGPGMEEPLILDGNLTVDKPLKLEFNITPPTVTLVLRVFDFQTHTPVSANVSLVYRGPYGTGTLRATAEGGALKLSLPAGAYTVEVTAEYYKPSTISLNLLASKEARVNLDPILAPLKLTIVDPDGNRVDGALVKLVYQVPQLSPPPMVSINGTVSPRGGVRVGRYKVIVTPPPKTPLKPLQFTVTVGLKGYETQVVLPYKSYNVTILLKDYLFKRPIPFPYKLELSRQGAAKPPAVEYPKIVTVKGGRANLTLPYGVYTCKLKPVSQDYYVLPPSITFKVDRNGEVVNITLKPRQYTITVMVVNDRSEPVAGALVELIDTRTHAVVASGLTSKSGSVTLKAYYGIYQVSVAQSAYKPASIYIEVPRQKSVTLTVYPTPLTVVKRMTPLFVGLTGLIALIAVLWKVKSVIAERLSEQEEYF